MPVTFKDFLIVQSESGHSVPDAKRLEKLSDKEFREIYVNEMKQFVRYHGHNPICTKCSVVIDNPESLVRYFGGNYHNSCFQEEYKNERSKLREYEVRYLDLVAKMAGNK